MRCLLIISGGYSVKKSAYEGFLSNNWSVRQIMFRDFFDPYINSFITRFESMPGRVKKTWKGPYIRRINKEYLKVLNEEKPDLVFIYNNQFLLPSTVSAFKRSCKVVFILGDNPLYTPTNPYNVEILKFADYIISPDTFWINQLETLGIKNVFFDCFSYSSEEYFNFSPTREQVDKFGSDLVYIGAAHKSNWGYKRFLFLNQFNNKDIKIFLNGDGYKARWKELFPELESKIIKHDTYDQRFNNIVYNCSKIAPIELVPSLFNGIHIRVFDVLGAGIFPLCEYSKDLETLFQGLDVPFVRNYYEAEGLANYLLEDDAYRLNLVRQMKERVDYTHNPAIVIGRMLDKVFS